MGSPALSDCAWCPAARRSSSKAPTPMCARSVSVSESGWWSMGVCAAPQKIFASRFNSRKPPTASRCGQSGSTPRRRISLPCRMSSRPRFLRNSGSSSAQGSPRSVLCTIRPLPKPTICISARGTHSIARRPWDSRRRATCSAVPPRPIQTLLRLGSALPKRRCGLNGTGWSLHRKRRPPPSRRLTPHCVCGLIPRPVCATWPSRRLDGIGTGLPPAKLFNAH